MEQLNLITNFLRIKDKNITITDEYDMGTHLELHGHLDYTAPKCPKCKGQMAKYDYQKTSKIPYLETAGYPLLIRLRKRRFKCKDCGKNKQNANITSGISAQTEQSPEPVDNGGTGSSDSIKRPKRAKKG